MSEIYKSPLSPGSTNFPQANIFATLPHSFSSVKVGSVNELGCKIYTPYVFHAYLYFSLPFIDFLCSYSQSLCYSMLFPRFLVKVGSLQTSPGLRNSPPPRAGADNF